MKHAELAFALLTAVMLAAPAASAQDDQPEESEQRTTFAQDQPGDTSAAVALEQPTDGPSVSIRGGYRFQFKSDFDGAPGDFSVSRTLIGVTLADSINDSASYSLDFLAERSSYDFGAASTLAPGSSDPLDDALSFTLTPSFRFELNDDWAVRAGGALIVAGETDADFSQSIRASIFGGVEHRLSDRLTVSLLLVAWSRLEDDAIIFPLIGVSWRINELMRVQTRGLGAEFISDLGNGWSLGARAAWEYREFRLNDDSSAPLPEGVMRDSGVIASLELAWKPSSDVVLAIEGGGVFAQELEFLDRGGVMISETDADTAFFVGVRASIDF